MAINFPDNPSDGDIATVGGVTYTYTASSNTWKPPVPGASASTLTDLSISDGTAGQLLTTDGNNNFSFTSIASASSTEIFADMAAIIAKTGMSAGDQGLVLENNKLFMYTGSAWYLIATMINNSPTAITNVDSTYNLAIDGTPTVITAVSTDPEGFPLTWSYAVTSGSLGSTATISQTDNVFTITPSTNSGDAGEFSITFSATDGGSSGIVNKVTSISLAFAVINSKYTTLLATATEISDNNNIIDSSTNNHSITVNGDVCAGTFSPYRSGGYSTYFDGTGDYIDTNTNLHGNFGTGDYTVEAWVYLDETIGSNRAIFGSGTSDSNDEFTLVLLSSGQLYFDWGNSGQYIQQSSSTFTANTWHHVAITRSGTQLDVWLDGVSAVSSSSHSFDYTGTSTFKVGMARNGSFYWKGYITDARIVNGTAITPPYGLPKERLEAITNTSLLTCHLPYISDGSINNHTITSNGNVTTQPFSPYDYTEYDPNVHGGSVYFDGSGDYLQLPSDAGFSFGTGDFTVECWVYYPPIANTNGKMIIDSRPTSTNGSYWNFGASPTGNIAFTTMTIGGNTIIDTVARPDQWVHYAVTRSGTSLRLFANGTLVASTTDSSNISSASPTIGKNAFSGQAGDTWWQGYISNFRVIKGTAVYTANFTPPTAPLSSSGSSLHIKGTDASIIDKSQTANIQLFGNTTGSTTQVKFADTKSMYFDGTGDYLETSSTSLDNFNFGTGDFTVECFIRNVYIPSTYFDILGTANNAAYVGSNRGGWMLSYYTSQNLKFSYQYNNSWIFENSFAQTLNINTWYHIAVTRQGTQLKCFVDGNQVGSTITDSTNLISTEPFNIGRGYGGVKYANSYIQDVRITKGLARYTANFTPPIESLKG